METRIRDGRSMEVRDLESIIEKKTLELES